MALTLYNSPGSSNALKVRILLAELGLAHEVVDVPMARPRPDWYTEFHPFGTVPALRDGSAVIGESNTILRYLAAREGRTDLYPLEPLGRALVDWIMDTWSMHLRPLALEVERPALFGAAPDTAAVEAALPGYIEALEKIERLVRGDGTLCPGGVSIADFCAAPTLYRANRIAGIPWERLPRLAAVRDGVLAHPAFAAAGPVR
jgi:glutathione S-transferase